MDVILAVVTTILGALIGGPIGFLFERIYSRPRVALDYAQTMYQDVYKFPSKTRGLVKQNTEFVHFMGSLTPWRFDQRLNGNVFTKGELAIIANLGDHFLEQRREDLRSLEKTAAVLKDKSLFVSAFEPATEEDEITLLQIKVLYKQQFKEDLFIAFKENQDDLLNKLQPNVEHGLIANKMLDRALNEFISLAHRYLQSDYGSSDNIVVRVGISNRGFQDEIIRSEGELLLIEQERKFRAPRQIGSRPWEVMEPAESTDYFVLKGRSFQVLEFLVDPKLNAEADIHDLRKALDRGCDFSFRVKAIGGSILKEVRYKGFLRQMPHPSVP